MENFMFEIKDYRSIPESSYGELTSMLRSLKTNQSVELTYKQSLSARPICRRLGLTVRILKSTDCYILYKL